MADKQELVDQFVGVTGIDAERARFHLESAAWNLELAMASFYEDGDGEQPIAVDIDETEEETEQSPAADVSLSDRQRTGGASSSRFATLSSMKQDDEDSNDAQAFYAGGSERSGQQVLGPPRKKVNPDEMVESLFKSAKEHGAEVVESNEPQKKAGPSFRGSGYRLGDTEEQSDVVPGTHKAPPKQVDMVLKLWKQGFSIGDGPLRQYSDPANKEFLDTVGKGEVPRELIRQARGGEVNLNMEDHRNEDYVKPKVAVRAFTGEGHMLGSPAPNLSSNPAETAGASSQTTSGPGVSVDESQPTTNLQIRLVDGKRLIAKLNHSHRISDIRKYIISSHPQFANTNFVLMTTFPNKELTDESETLEDAKLLNAVIVQRQK